MALSAKQVIVERQLAARKRLWPEVTDSMLWNPSTRVGYAPVPRVMPLMMSIMDDLSGKGFPVGQTYLEMWTRLQEELFLTLNRPEEMAFHAGFSGQRAARTWKDRVRRLVDLGFIGVKPGPLGDMSYAILFNPFHVIKRAYLRNEVQEAKWQALIIRSYEIGAFDLEEIDDNGKLVEPQPAPEKAPVTGKNPRLTRKVKIKSQS